MGISAVLNLVCGILKEAALLSNIGQGVYVQPRTKQH